MVISGIYVETIPGKVEAAAKKLALIEGVEIHHLQDDYKIVLTLEAGSVDQSYQTAETFKDVEGVLGICLVYTHFEDDPNYHSAEHLNA
ncbi:chaperone NapD [Bacillus marasmi]|uniref:chaperone NapD n=1 Tax=Bacillus marasmi TaxID=1926279 RepID=UPI0011C8F9FD|nr:chaperone NapD [Bacillus marasmi]